MSILKINKKYGGVKSYDKKSTYPTKYQLGAFKKP